ncbi:MAG: energy transducer TonB [Bacteroides sp.]|nr:energy transducer TonB [Bacteroides sp.]
MEQKQKGKYIGIGGALLVHLLVVAFLLLMGFTVPKAPEEDGLPVMLGELPDAAGLADPSLVEVDVVPEVEEMAPETPDEAEMLTQDLEESVAIAPKSAAEKKTEVKQKTAEEKAEEERLLAEAEAARKRKEAEEAARKRVAGAFGKGAKMGSKGTTEGEGLQGSDKGNALSGAVAGVGGYGEFSLGGRSIGKEGLPRPVYNVQEEGKVVVSITVNPAGKVIATSIHRTSNTISSALRKAAEDAARKAVFNAVDGLDNQQGTITYYFNLK